MKVLGIACVGHASAETSAFSERLGFAGACVHISNPLMRIYILTYRYMATGKFSKLKDMQNSPEPGQRSAALLAIYLKNRDPSKKKQALEALLEQAKKDPTAMYLAVCACVLAGEEETALSLIMEAGRKSRAGIG